MAFQECQIHVAAHRKSLLGGVSDRLEGWLEQEHERLGLWVPLTLASGIAAWFAFPNAWYWSGWIAFWAGLACLAVLLPDGGRLQRILVVLAICCAAGCLLVWGKALTIGERPIARAAFVELRARIESVRPLPARGMTRLVVIPEPARTDLPHRIRVNVMEKDIGQGVGKGALIAFRSRLMPPPPPAVPGAYDFAEKAYFSGIGATGRALPPLRVIEPSTDRSGSLRQRLSRHIQTRLGGGEGGIATALATGDTGAISEVDADAMRHSGLAHLLSISGLHVSALIAAVIFMLMRLLALSPRLALNWPLLAIAAAGGAAAGIGYTLLTGAEVPTVRSCVAALLVLVGFVLGREALSLRLIAAGALVVLLLWPEALVGPSFQMSFMAVIALVALAESRWFHQLTHARDETAVKKAGRVLLALLLTGIAVEIALMPIALYHFHQTGLLGALANLVAIPLTTFVVMPLEALALFLDVIGLGAPAWWGVGKALSLLLFVAHHTAAQSMSVLVWPVFPSWAMGGLIFGMLWIVLWQTQGRWLGLLPVVTGIAAIAMAPAPDLLVTGDGRHLALRLEDGRMALLRAKAGDYVRDTLGSAAGMALDAEDGMMALADLPNARCSLDWCAADVEQSGRRWRVLASRTHDRVPWRDIVRDCAAADIVVSDRTLPRACLPRWVKLDRRGLAATGGVALYLKDARIVTVRQPGDRHPWMLSPTRGK